MRTWIDRIFAVSFVLILAAPLLQMLTHIVPEHDLEERRIPREIQKPFARIVEMDPHLSDEANNWFNDHYGFRSTLIRVKNEIDYQLFSTSEKVIIGREGWLFNKDFVNHIVEDANNPSLDQRSLTALRSLRDCLARRHVLLVVVINAAKSVIYKQFFPYRMPVDPPERAARRLADLLRFEPGILFIDGEQILAEHSNDTLFYKTDIHMNLKASSYVYRSMLAQIASKIDKEPPSFPPESWTALPWNAGSEERFLAKFIPMNDTTYMTPAESSANRNDAFDLFENDVGIVELPQYSKLPLYDFIYTNLRASTTLFPPTVVFATSFIDGFFDLEYNQAFSKIYRTRSNIPQRLGPILGRLPSEVQILILEFPEPFLTLTLNMDTPRDCRKADAKNG